MFPHRNIHKYTWTFPDGKTHKQNDYTLVDRRRDSSILDVEIFRGADCATDHYLLIEKVRQRVVVNKQAVQKFDGERLCFRKLSDQQFRKQNWIKISNRSVDMGKLSDSE